jgi:hypothetical protein
MMPSKYPNSGTLSRNQRKEEENHADFKGSAEIEGVDYWISGWIKEGQYGKFFSLSFKPKEPKPAAVTAPADDFDDEIPF